MIFLYSMLVGKDLDILRMGDDSARALGIDTKRIAEQPWCSPAW